MQERDLINAWAFRVNHSMYLHDYLSDSKARTHRVFGSIFECLSSFEAYRKATARLLQYEKDLTARQLHKHELQ
jgi:hypothetical protein